MKKIFLFISAIVIVLCLIVAMTIKQTPKNKVEKCIAEWYENHPDKYSLDITGNETIAMATRYHIDRPEEANSLIVIEWKGMKITMSFKKAIKDITWNKDSLQANFSYIVLDDIYHDVKVKGWDIAPRTPQSSASKGVVFTKAEGKQLGFEVNWETYTFFGYSNSNKCQKELQIADSSMPEECYVSVEKRLPLYLNVDVKVLEK